MNTKITLALFLAILSLSFGPTAHADETFRCNGRVLTLDQTKTAITQGGNGTGVILGTRNPATGMLEIGANGDAQVRNDTDCPVPISIASYQLQNPNDPDFRNQTLYGKTQQTIVQPHSSATLHVNLPPCNYQADYFFGNNAGTNGDRYVQSQYFLEAGYVVNRANAGGTQCATPSPTPVPTPPPTYTPPNAPTPPSYTPPPYYSSPPTYYYPPPQYPQSPQIVQTAMQIQPQYVQLPEYVPLTEIPYTGLDDYPLSTIYTVAAMFWAIIIGIYLLYRKARAYRLQ